ncbi:unnamed protein product [Schistosoma spindalis]|nr:unnamed protein product [Schistosoma spindale]
MSTIHKTTQRQGLHSIAQHKTSLINNNNNNNNMTSLQSELLLLDQLLDQKQIIDYLLNKNTFSLFNDDTKLWTIEWLQNYLDILTEFGQILLKSNKNCTIHLNIDDILPVTCLWHSYLQRSLMLYSIEDIITTHNDPYRNQKINFQWDMYIILHKPNQYQLRPYLFNNNNNNNNNNHNNNKQSIMNYIPNYYYLTIPSMNIEKMESSIESYKKQEINDPYELFRISDHFTLIDQLDQWDLISPQKICQLLFTIILPECLNATLINDLNQNSLKVISWKCLFNDNDINKVIEQGYYPIEVVFDLNSIGVNSFYYKSELWKTQQLTRKIQLNKSNHLLSTSIIDHNNNNNNNKSERSYHSSVTMPNILIMYINFHPVFSFNDLINNNTNTNTNMNNHLSKTQLATTTNRYISIYWKQNFLKYIPSLELINNQLNPDLPLWSICNSIKQDYILQKINFFHSYLHYKSIRILLNLLQFNDLLYHTNLLKLFNIKNIIELYLQLINEQFNQSINNSDQNQLNNLNKKSIYNWQYQYFYEFINDLLKKMIHILFNKKLLSITSPESNLLYFNNNDIINKIINQSYMILNSWYHSPLQLRKLILKKIEILTKFIHQFNLLYPDKQIS